MSPVDRVVGALLAAAALAGTVWVSNAPLTVHPSPDAVLRVAWSVLPERVETCREPSADELSRLPAHMRQRLVCEGAAAAYRLTVRAGAASIADRTVRAGGLRHDRRLFVFEEIRLPAGAADVDVRFERIDAAAGATAGTTARTTFTPMRESVPPRLAYAGRLTFPSRGVILVTYDAARRALVVRPAGTVDETATTP
jgi:hypothetical protein